MLWSTLHGALDNEDMEINGKGTIERSWFFIGTDFKTGRYAKMNLFESTNINTNIKKEFY